MTPRVLVRLLIESPESSRASICRLTVCCLAPSPPAAHASKEDEVECLSIGMVRCDSFASDNQACDAAVIFPTVSSVASCVDESFTQPLDIASHVLLPTGSFLHQARDARFDEERPRGVGSACSRWERRWRRRARRGLRALASTAGCRVRTGLLVKSSPAPPRNDATLEK